MKVVTWLKHRKRIDGEGGLNLMPKKSLDLCSNEYFRYLLGSYGDGYPPYRCLRRYFTTNAFLVVQSGYRNCITEPRVLHSRSGSIQNLQDGREEIFLGFDYDEVYRLLDIEL
jgi:hypothetical protein